MAEGRAARDRKEQNMIVDITVTLAVRDNDGHLRYEQKSFVSITKAYLSAPVKLLQVVEDAAHSIRDRLPIQPETD